jgi:hypothetical protein
LSLIFLSNGERTNAQTVFAKMDERLSAMAKTLKEFRIASPENQMTCRSPASQTLLFNLQFV